MAFVMKSPQGSSKGLLVLSHREQALVRASIGPFARILPRLGEHYFIAVHHGRPASDLAPAPWVDLHFAPNRSVSFSAPVRRVPFDCSHFVSGYFQARSVEKHWDIVAVCRGPNRRDVRQALQALRIVKDRRPQTRAWLVCAAGRGLPTPGGDDVAFYRELFSAQERQQIVLTVFEGSAAPFGLPRRDLAWFLAATRVLFISGAYDGVARQVSEALACGASAVLPRSGFEGRLPTRIEEGVRWFGDEAEAATALCAWLERPSGLDLTNLRRRVGEMHTIPKLIDALRAMYEQLGVPWQGPLDTEELAVKLPSHAAGLAPAEVCLPDSSLLRSSPAMLLYLQGLATRAGAVVRVGRIDSLHVEMDSLGQRGSEKARGLLHQARRAMQGY